MVPSSSKYVTPAMRGKPTRLSRNYQRRNGGNFWRKAIILYLLIFKRRYHSRDDFYTLSRRFFRQGLRLNCVRLAVHYFAVYSVLGIFFNKQLNLNGSGNEYNGSAASRRYNSLLISLPFVTKQQREIASFCIFERT